MSQTQNTKTGVSIYWMLVCVATLCVCVCVPCSTDLGCWRLEWLRWPLGLDTPTRPPGSRPGPAWPGSVPSWSSAPETQEHQVPSSLWLAAQQTPHAGGGDNRTQGENCQVFKYVNDLSIQPTGGQMWKCFQCLTPTSCSKRISSPPTGSQHDPDIMLLFLRTTIVLQYSLISSEIFSIPPHLVWNITSFTNIPRHMFVHIRKQIGKDDMKWTA